MPARAAANEIDWPWLPRVAETTPAIRGCDRVRRSMYTRPPRTLNAPVGVWFSCFTHTVQPARLRSLGQAYCGVGAITRYTRVAARSSSLSVMAVRDSPIGFSKSGKRSDARSEYADGVTNEVPDMRVRGRDTHVWHF